MQIIKINSHPQVCQKHQTLIQKQPNGLFPSKKNDCSAHPHETSVFDECEINHVIFSEENAGFKQKTDSSNHIHIVNLNLTKDQRRKLLNQSNTKNTKPESSIIRQFLKYYLSYCELPVTELIESYPLRLKHLKGADNDYFVSFTHSINSFGIVIHPTHAIGIDIEQNQVSMEVANRFLNSKEITIIEQSELSKKIKLQIINILWSLKECLIKIHQVSLLHGLRIDCSLVIEPIIKVIKKKSQGEMLIHLDKDWYKETHHMSSNIPNNQNWNCNHIYVNLNHKLVAVF